MKRIRIYLPLFLLMARLLPCPAPLLAQHPADVSPRLTRTKMEEFLLKAKALKTRGVRTGITGTRRATLSDGRLTHDASVQTVEIHKTSYPTARGTELNFRDSYKFNVAAYRLDKLLGLNMIPVSVERKIAGKWAAVTWWVDDVRMTERRRYAKKIEPPDKTRWNEQIYQVRVFNELVYNTDANQGNLLITNDWKIVLIDFSRAFRTHKKLRHPMNLSRIHRGFYNGLRELDESDVKRELGPYLRESEITGLMARRDVILEFFDREISRKGEAAVIGDPPFAKTP